MITMNNSSLIMRHSLMMMRKMRMMKMMKMMRMMRMKFEEEISCSEMHRLLQLCSVLRGGGLYKWNIDFGLAVLQVLGV